MEMKWVFTSLEPRHLDTVVDIHMRAFPNFFLAFLGPRFLKEFYAAFLYEPTGIGFVAEQENTGRILGVIVGMLHPEGFFTRLLKALFAINVGFHPGTAPMAPINHGFGLHAFSLGQRLSSATRSSITSAQARSGFWDVSVYRVRSL